MMKVILVKSRNVFIVFPKLPWVIIHILKKGKRVESFGQETLHLVMSTTTKAED